jgi:hypothetical protein
MPRIWVAHQSDAHRLACTRSLLQHVYLLTRIGTSLYRALLKQCDRLAYTSASSGTPLTSSTLKSIVHYQFRKHWRLKGLNPIRNAINQGKGTLSLLLRANGGSIPALADLASALRKLLEQRAAEVKVQDQQALDQASRPPTKWEVHVARHSDPTNHRPSLSSPGLSAHPYPLSALKSKSRIVPSLVRTNKDFPFLRYGRQPIQLSRVIRQKSLWKEKAWEHTFKLEDLIALGDCEDEWDTMVWAQAQTELGTSIFAPQTPDLQRDDSESWAIEALRMHQDLHALIHQKNEKAVELGEKMWTIVKQEQCLKNWEDLPVNVARTARTGRKLEIKVWKFAENSSGKYRFALKSHNVSIAVEIECKRMGRFRPKVEWAVRKIERESKTTAELEQSLLRRENGKDQSQKRRK